jgi:hypothetical protein
LLSAVATAAVEPAGALLMLRASDSSAPPEVGRNQPFCREAR